MVVWTLTLVRSFVLSLEFRVEFRPYASSFHSVNGFRILVSCISRGLEHIWHRLLNCIIVDWSLEFTSTVLDSGCFRVTRRGLAIGVGAALHTVRTWTLRLNAYTYVQPPDSLKALRGSRNTTAQGHAWHAQYVLSAGSDDRTWSAPSPRVRQPFVSCES